MALTNYPEAALLPCGLTSHSKRRVGMQKAMRDIVSFSLFSHENKRRGRTVKYSIGTEFVKDFMDSRDGELAKDAEFCQLLVVDCDSDATGFLRKDNHGARQWRRRVLDEACGEELVQIRVHFLGSRTVNTVGPRRDGRAVRRNRNLERKQGAGAGVC